MKRSFEALLESWSNEFAARTNRVRALIGDAHWLSDGMHKERLLQGFIIQRLPSTVAAGHGFLVDPNSERCSPELDVLIRDCLHSAPLLDESGITICHPQSLMAFFEVKSNFTATTLEEALALVAETQEIISGSNEPSAVWRAIVFTGEYAERTDDSILGTLTEKIGALCDALTCANGQHVHYLPTCIFCVDRFIAFLGASQNGGRCKLRYFSTGRLSFATGITDMLSHVYSRAGVQSFQPLDESVEQAVRVPPTMCEL
jgi:hypothetical protein